jgi:hypothetical protein
MNFQFYLEKLFVSENFQEFKKENPDAYPCSGFFMIDFEKSDNQFHFDYFIPSTKRMFSFKLESEIEKVPVDIIDKRIPEKLSMNYSFDFDDVVKLIEEKMQQENVKSKIQKVLLSLQKLDKGDFLLGTVFISALGILKVKINISEMKIISFEKKSFLDMMKIIKK